MQVADVFINPVMNGSGIQTKNIEALAKGCNVVATAFAATGLPGYLINKKLFVSANQDWVHLPKTLLSPVLLPILTPQQFYLDYQLAKYN